MYELDEEFSEYMDEMIAATKQTNWGFHDEEVIINNWNIIFWYMSIDIDKFTTEHMGITLSDTVLENQNIEHVFFGYPNCAEFYGNFACGQVRRLHLFKIFGVNAVFGIVLRKTFRLT